MKFQEILGRLRGLSSPVFGVSWEPTEPEIQVARRVIVFLEDRRVLYTPSEMELPEHCIQSVCLIREMLTQELQGLSKGTGLSESLRAMRSACRKFMNAVGVRSEIALFATDRSHWASWEFNGNVGELRGVFGVHLAQLAASHGLEIEDDLARILPGVDELSKKEEMY